MTTQQLFTADLLDILFEHRNKAYGAYALRKAYPKNLMKAVGIMLLLVIALCFYVMSQKSKTVYTDPVYRELTEVTLSDSKLPVEKQPQTRTVDAQPPTKVDRPPVIVPDHTIIDHPVPDRTDSTAFVPGTTDSPGTGADGSTFVQGTVSTNATVISEEPAVPETPVILSFAEVQPEFPGGAAAWMSYLQRMLQVPDNLESGDRKTVKVKFVVNNNGDVTNAVIVQSGGNAFDREVLRVIARMPRWNPGRQNGKPVAVYFTQPVTFAAMDE